MSLIRTTTLTEWGPYGRIHASLIDFDKAMEEIFCNAQCKPHMFHKIKDRPASLGGSVETQVWTRGGSYFSC